MGSDVSSPSGSWAGVLIFLHRGITEKFVLLIYSNEWPES